MLTVITVRAFLLGALSLLAKEVATSGYVSVTVHYRDGRSSTERVPVSSTSQRDQAIALANWLQQTAAFRYRTRGAAGYLATLVAKHQISRGGRNRVVRREPPQPAVA